MNIKYLSTLLAVLLSNSLFSEDKLPIIDMHLHTVINDFPLSLCIPWVTQYPAKKPGVDWSETWLDMMTKNPPCDNPIHTPEGDAAVMKETVAVMERNNIFGVLTGQPDELKEWQNYAPDRFYLSAHFNLGKMTAPSPSEFEELLNSSPYKVIGEISNQYAGIAVNDPRMDPYWALAEKMDIPVAVHMGEGTVGTAYLGMPGLTTYRASLSNPLLLEDVLVKYPNLRISVMHYGAPFVDEMIAILGSHPQVYIDIGGIQWYYPREFFYSHLKKFIDAGYLNRIMFGSDQGSWPGVIEPAIQIIDEAPFLNQKQKREIFYNNAARFLNLTKEEIAKHHRVK